MTLAEFRLLLRVSAPRFRRLLVFLRWTGARPKEVCDLQWSFIDFERRVITLNKHKTDKTRRDGKPRTIHLHPVIVKMLIYVRRRQLADRVQSPFVFLNRFAKQSRAKDLAKWLLRLRAKFGIDETCKLYGLRHGFGTRAVLNGVDLATLKVLMGHTRITTTARYVHVEEEDDHLQAALAQSGKPRGRTV